MIPGFDQNGNLPVGFIKPTIGEFKERFAVEFGNSRTRGDIFTRYIDYCERMNYLKVAVKQWVDGSYTTNKENPNDIDLVTHIDALKVNERIEIHEDLTKLLDNAHCKNQYRCDVYAIFIYSKEFPDKYEYYKKVEEYWSKYWLKCFGHDRNENSKGIIEFSFLNGDFEFGDMENGRKRP